MDGFAWWQLKAVARPSVSQDATEMLDQAWEKYRLRAAALVASATDETRARVHYALQGHGVVIAALGT